MISNTLDEALGPMNESNHALILFYIAYGLRMM